jgi:diacylglycerol kinase family enzyme
LQKAILLYNPSSGRRQDRREADVETAADVLRAAGVEVIVSETLGAARTAVQVSQQIADGCDTVIACGGDGTIHDVLQGLVGTGAALGIIPLGTANSLAKDLGLPASPKAAARALLTAKPKHMACGHIFCTASSGESISRYFTVTAGIGADAEVFRHLSANHKRRLGHAAYYVQATKLLLTHSFPQFRVTFKESRKVPEPGTSQLQDVQTEDVQTENAEVTQLLAVRIRNFGGLLRELAPGASLERDDLRLVLFRTQSRWTILSYALRAALNGKWHVRGVDLAYAASVLCEPLPGHSSPIFVEADGELLGTLPAEISVVRDALTLLMP